MVKAINSVIGGFSWVDLVWLAASTVRLQLYRMISENEAADEPIIFEEIIMVMISRVIMQIVSLKLSGSWKKQIKNKKIKPNLNT